MDAERTKKKPAEPPVSDPVRRSVELPKDRTGARNRHPVRFDRTPESVIVISRIAVAER